MSNQPFDVQIKRKARSITLRLAVHASGRVVVSAPYFMPERLIESFIAEKTEWILDTLNHFESLPKPILPKQTKADYKRLKPMALALAQERIAMFNEVYKFNFNRISIKNQKTCWGSCSRKGNLNFNYKIALLPPHLADYVIVHELCHLGELNHSKRFWELVEKTVPEYRRLKRELRGAR